MRLLLIGAMALIVSVATNSEAQVLLLAPDGSGGDLFGGSVAISADGNTAIIGAPFDTTIYGVESGSAHVFVRESDGSWIHQQQLHALNASANDRFGSSVAISAAGDAALIGAPFDTTANGSAAGSAHFFVRATDGTWVAEQQLLAPDGEVNDWFGFKVALDGAADSAFVTARLDDDPSAAVNGSVHSFVRTVDGMWSHHQKLLPPVEGRSFGDGLAVSNDGNTVVIGSSSDVSPSGAVQAGSAHIFLREPSGDWTQHQQLYAPDGASGDVFGSAVALSSDGETVVVGARSNDEAGYLAGSAYVFARSFGGSWIHDQKLIAPDANLLDTFGASVAVSGTGDLIIVGSPGDYSIGGVRAGSVYVFVQTPVGAWVHDAQLLAFESSAEDKFGSSVAISTVGATVVIGAWLDDTPDGVDAGSAFVLDRDSTGKWQQPLPSPGLRYVDVVAADLPTAYWRLNELATPFFDSIGGRLGMQIAGSILTQLPGAPRSGSDPSISSGPNGGTIAVPLDAAMTTPTFSIELWAKFGSSCADALLGHVRCNLAGSPPGGPSVGYAIGAEDGANGESYSFQVSVQDPQPTQFRLDGPPVQLGEWSHLVGMYDGAIQRLYVNGRLEAWQQAKFTPDIDRHFELFGSADATAERVNLDEVALYGRPLLSSEVAAHFATAARDPEMGTMTPPYSISAGITHTCVLDDVGVQCWGWNTEGQSQAPPLSNPTAISAGGYHTCAIDESDVVCWGRDVSGQATPPILSNPTVVSAGRSHSCAIADGSVHCWGRDDYGQSSPPPLSDAISVSAGVDHSCAVAANQVRCWGRAHGSVPSLSNPVAVSVGVLHSCALHDLGVDCWGGNADGQSTVPPLSNPTAVSAGAYHTCAVDDGAVRCWGSNDHDAARVPILSNPTSVVAGFDHTCALDDGGVRCWGNNNRGQTSGPSLLTPTAIASASTGSSHTCILDDRAVQCWGLNDAGQTDVPKLVNPRMVSAGANHSCALDDEGVQCWGRNSDGQTFVPPLLSPTAVSAGSNFSCALDDIGIQCWGFGNGGQTKTEDLSNASVIAAGFYYACALDDNGVHCWDRVEFLPLSVPTLSNPTLVSVGFDHSCAIDDDGVQCWGGNAQGQTDVPPLSNPISVSAASGYSCALDDNGVQCWGGGFSSGQTMVPAASYPTELYESGPSGSHTCALDEGGLRCWGRNSYMQTAVPRTLELLDFDKDGLLNIAELYALFTDPVSSDTDGDLLPDGAEIDIYFTDPSVADINADSDGDGLTNVSEIDTHTTNPLVGDTDSDGLTDGAEVNVHSTNPLFVDSDSDGFDDGTEIASGTNPLDPLDMPVVPQVPSLTLLLYGGLLLSALALVSRELTAT